MDLESVAIIGIIGVVLYYLYQAETTNAAGASSTNSVTPSSSGTGGLLNALANAIAQEEGWNVPGSVSQRNNNPGNIGGAAKSFSTPEAGWAALTNQLNAIFNGFSTNYDTSMTLSQMGLTYANGDPQWGINVASILGVSPDTTLAELQSQYGGL